MMAEGWSREETALGACGRSANARSSLSGSHGSSSGLWAKRTEVPGLAGELALLVGHGWRWHHKYIPRTFKNKGHGKESRKKQVKGVRGVQGAWDRLSLKVGWLPGSGTGRWPEAPTLFSSFAHKTTAFLSLSAVRSSHPAASGQQEAAGGDRCHFEAWS